MRDQAWEYACENTPDDGSIMMESVYDHRFAEMIVKECIRIAEKSNKYGTHAAIDIAGYFGTKE